MHLWKYYTHYTRMYRCEGAAIAKVHLYYTFLMKLVQMLLDWGERIQLHA